MWVPSALSAISATVRERRPPSMCTNSKMRVDLLIYRPSTVPLVLMPERYQGKRDC
jgi:hypothetical protein